MTHGSVGTAGALLLVLACGPTIARSSDAEGSDAGSDPTSTSIDAPATENEGTTDGTTTADGGEAESADSGTSSGASSSSSSTGDIDVPPGFIPGESRWGPCSPYAQDCPPGEKCTWWANDGATTWNATRCVPVDPDPDGLEQPCTTEAWLSGIDSCDVGLICLHVDLDSNVGTCTALCMGTDSNALCLHADYACWMYGSGTMPLCRPRCDPLVQDCPHDLGCYRSGDDFVCTWTLTLDGGFGEPCDIDTGCAPGLACVPLESIEGCIATPCCTAYCDLAAPQCPADQECIPVFESGQAPFGHDDVGYCNPL